MEIKWTCKQCNEKNVDDSDFTGVPMCNGCGKNTEWFEIETKCTCQPLSLMGGEIYAKDKDCPIHFAK